MILTIIYILTLLILFFVVFLAIRTTMKIRNISPNKKNNDKFSKIEVTDNDLITKLKELKKMHQEGVINKTEFKLAKDKLLKKQ
tara:strand:+ start:691 stop:942 length:252 start_codon:yes stop_codon:yes gene_type:complete